MQFLNPMMLLGLAAAAVPIVLHFLSRRRLREIDFAPIRFLMTTQERQMRRMSLRRLLLLLIRIAIITAVVMALARPTLTGGLASLMRGGEGASVVLLVDASASMRAQLSSGTLFERAQEQVASIAGEFGPDDEIAILLFHDGTEPLLGEFVRDPDVVLAVLNEAEPSFRGTDYLNALDGGLDMLERANRTQRELYLVSDFQTAELDTLRLARMRSRLTSTSPTNVFLRALDSEPFANRQIVAVDRPATLLRSGQTASIAVIVRQEDEAQTPVQLFLQLSGTTIGEAELLLPPRGEGRHVFPLTLPNAGDLGGSVRLRPDRLAIDDERFFVLDVGDQVPALVLTGVEGSEGENDPTLFLVAALDPSARGEGVFALTVESAESFDVEALASARVVVGSDLRALGAARLAALTEYLESGGTLLLFVGDPRVREYTNSRLLPVWTDVQLGDFRSASDSHERLEIVALDHPVFAGFEADELETLREVQLRSFYRLPENRGLPLLRFRDGGAAILELSVGRGRVMLCGFHTAATAGDLPYSPMFLPLVQRLAGYLATAGWGRFGRQFAVGEQISIAAPAGAAAVDRYEVVLPDGARRTATLDESVTPARVSFGPATAPGLHSFERDGLAIGMVAVNVPVSESASTRMDLDEFRKTFGSNTKVAFRSLEGESTSEAVQGARHGVPMHRWFLALAGLLLVIESLISRRVGPAPV